MPTLAPTAAIPAPLNESPSPSPSSQNFSLEELFRQTTDGYLEAWYLTTYREYRGQIYPDNRTGYDLDITIAQADNRSREELLAVLYSLFHDFYFEATDVQPMFLVLHLREFEGAGTTQGCVFGAGIGYLSIADYLPQQPPADLEGWFQRLHEQKYYGDLPGETEALLAYGNDPAKSPGCVNRNWR
ncbi:MAG: hypothetical protein KDE28_29870 [Anaerolineales bacterium]|nr:hypothetical protein [Anaerolineales bacterium]